MLISPFTSPVLAPLLSAEEARLFDDESMAAAMLAAEAALARAGAACGLVPKADARRICAAAKRLSPDLAKMGAAAARNGPPVAALVEQLRDESKSRHVHFGATSQDIVDTAVVLQLRAFMDLTETRLRSVGDMLAELAKRHKRSAMPGRTRWRHAVPTTFGLKAANWLMPLARHLERLHQLRPRVLTAQLGGPVGSLGMGGPSAKGGADGLRLAAEFARQLDLAEAVVPWHQQRDGLAEAASWLALLCASLGKIAGDVLLLQQEEVGELSVGDGRSTAMPGKRNPVPAETVCALATFAAAQLPVVLAAMRTAHERGGDAWQAEWLALPTLAAAAAGALRSAGAMLSSMKVDVWRMEANLAAKGFFGRDELPPGSAPDAPSAADPESPQLLEPDKWTEAAPALVERAVRYWRKAGRARAPGSGRPGRR